MSLQDLMSGSGSKDEFSQPAEDEFSGNDQPDESQPSEDEAPEADFAVSAEAEADEGDFLTSADIDPRLLARSVQVDTAEEEFRATSAEGFDNLIRNLRLEQRPYRIINRFTGKVYDNFLDFVPEEQAE